jgi:hypothetical protein
MILKDDNTKWGLRLGCIIVLASIVGTLALFVWLAGHVSW